MAHSAGMRTHYFSLVRLTPVAGPTESPTHIKQNLKRHVAVPAKVITPRSSPAASQRSVNTVQSCSALWKHSWLRHLGVKPVEQCGWDCSHVCDGTFLPEWLHTVEGNNTVRQRNRRETEQFSPLAHSKEKRLETITITRVKDIASICGKFNTGKVFDSTLFDHPFG